MKPLMTLTALALVTVCCVTACDRSDAFAVGDEAARREQPRQEQTEYIGAVPDTYFEEAKQQRQVTEIRYESRDYTADAEPAAEKTAYDSRRFFHGSSERHCQYAGSYDRIRRHPACNRSMRNF